MIFKVRLTVNGTEYAVAGASLDAPEGALGFSVTVALAKKDITGIPPGADVTLEIGVKEALADAYTYVPLISGGKLLGREYSVLWEEGKPGKPGDTVSFNAVSTFADKWQLAPKVPVTVYNPLTVNPDTLKPDTTNPLKDEATGAPIYPALEPVTGLSLKQVLDRAYTGTLPLLSPGHGSSLAGAGLGFSRVVTNLPNFPVDRIDFDYATGWHQPAAALVAIFEPVFFELDNVLYIIDPGRGLPESFPVRALSIGCMREAQHTVAPAEIVNAIILTYETRNPGISTGQGGVAGLIPSERFVEDEPSTVGSGGNAVRTEGTRKLREWKNLATGQVDYTQELEKETRTFAASQGAVKLLSTETLEVSYQGKLKTGHLKTTSALYPNPDTAWPKPPTGQPTIAVMKYGEVHTETNTVEFTTDPANPGESIIKRVITATEGLVLVEGKVNKTYTPILDAAKSNIIKGDGSQTVARMPIDTTIEELQQTGYNQTQVVARIIHHLTGTVETPPPTISRTGTPSTYNGNAGAGSLGLITYRELIKDAASIAQYGMRRAAELNIGQLDPVEGRRLVKRRLLRLGNPRRRVPFVINGIDFALHRGSIVKVPLRSGAYETSYLILSYKITLRGLLTTEPEITHNLEGLELG